MLGTSKNLAGQDFVAILEDKNHPFFMVQFHPEKNAWEKRSKTMEYLDRSKKIIEIVDSFVLNLIDYARWINNKNLTKCNYRPLDDNKHVYLSYNHLTFPYLGKTFESIYMFPKMSDCLQNCSDKIESMEYQINLFREYSEFRKVYLEKSEKSKVEDTELSAESDD